MWLPKGIKKRLRDFIASTVRAELDKKPVVIAGGPPPERISQYMGNGIILTETWFRRMMFVDGVDNSLSPHMIHTGYWEPWVTNRLLLDLRAGDAFIDIGSNVGYFTLLAAHLVGPTGKVVAFEPNARLHHLLRRSIDINGFLGHTTLSALGIGERVEQLVFSVDPAHLGNGVVRNTQTHYPDSVTIDVADLPSALKKLRVDLSDRRLFMKMDVEGAEHRAWRGMRDFLAARTLPTTFIVEFSPPTYRALGDNAVEFVEDMLRLGFSVNRMNHDGTETPFTPDMANAVIGHVDLILRK